MASVEHSVESVLSQFSVLSAKDQQKFAAEMARFLQGQPKSSGAKRSAKVQKAASSDAESAEAKPKRERSEKQKADFALKTAVRRFHEAAAQGDAAKAQDLARDAARALDKAAARA